MIRDLGAMDDSGFGIYKYYFKLLRTFGAFPYRVEGNAQKVIKLRRNTIGKLLEIIV